MMSAPPTTQPTDSTPATAERYPHPLTHSHLGKGPHFTRSYPALPSSAITGGSPRLVAALGAAATLGTVPPVGDALFAFRCV